MPSSTATLTIEPGVEVRFNGGTGLYIGADGYYGALTARGTADAPIVFTSNASPPAPGNWKGIYFTNETNDAKTVLEHCVVEYGGHTNNADLYLYNASFPIKSSTIRYSSGNGIYLERSNAAIGGDGDRQCDQQQRDLWDLLQQYEFFSCRYREHDFK